MTGVSGIIRYLTDLSENNNKEWFHANRQRYDEVKKASETLCAELIDGIRSFDPYIGTLSPKDCLFRIFRDTRFSKDKSPYRTGFAMFVARGGKKDVHHGYFFQIGAGTERSCVAAGHYFCPPQVLSIVREDIQMGNGDFRQVLSQVDNRLQMDYSGSYKKTPAGFPTDGPDADFYRLRNFGMWYYPDEGFLTAPKMLMGLLITLKMMPQVSQTFRGSYRQLMHTVGSIFVSNPCIRLYSLRPAMSFASMLCIWSCMAFHLADSPFHAGSDVVGLLGLCGVAGAIAASGVGKIVPRVGINRMSVIGGCFQVLAWFTAWKYGDSYTGLIAALVLVDIGAQCLQVSNQSASLRQLPEATNRVNTIFMTTFFIGGSLGTFFSGLGWNLAGWTGVCIVGVCFASTTLLLSAYERIKMDRDVKQ